MSPSATLALRCARGIGAAGFRRLVDETGSPDAALSSLDADVRTEAWERAARVASVAQARGIVILESGRASYPPSLADLEDAPPVMFALGDLTLLARPAVAIVGTRDATAYGLRTTRALAAAASSAGVTVVSGLARGVDACAHRAALEGSGRTIAVLGTGVDVAYPLENRALHAEVAARGLLLSEALPGTRAHPGSFPRRNRIIAALADVVLVTEAGLKSGARITAEHAAQMGRVLAAVPGPVDVASSAGTNALLRDGAHLVAGADDLLGLVHLTARGRGTTAAAVPGAGLSANPALAPDERAVLDALAFGPRLPDELLSATNLPAPVLAAALATLGMLGLTEVDPAGTVRAGASGSVR